MGTRCGDRGHRRGRGNLRRMRIVQVDTQRPRPGGVAACEPNRRRDAQSVACPSPDTEPAPKPPRPRRRQPAPSRRAPPSRLRHRSIASRKERINSPPPSGRCWHRVHPEENRTFRTARPRAWSAGPGLLFVDRVGVYQFPETDDMLTVYTERLQQYGIDYNTGQCMGGQGGETGWGPSFAPDDPEMPWARSGCYLDENNIANVDSRATSTPTLGSSGATATFGTLFAWAWESADGGYNFYGTAPGSASRAGRSTEADDTGRLRRRSQTNHRYVAELEPFRRGPSPSAARGTGRPSGRGDVVHDVSPIRAATGITPQP